MLHKYRDLAKEAEEYAEFYAAIADELEKDIFVRRFAELIVHECCIIVADAVDRREPASTYVSKILTHFGISHE